ncbi:hypothetical protein ACHAWO_003642 [Cyclotella atomus]|uniref:Glutamyl-tRNA(Gln) amidotransferase subunit B, mitochondrial n=1 Tax=Cyclotella atomus TaxID=382360 RepID=A0ABD3N9B8_9STRA
MFRPHTASSYFHRSLLLLANRRSSSALSSLSGASISRVELTYDRDTGIVWQTSSSKRIRPLYQTVIGIEIHAQLAIPTKLFSSAPTAAAPPNTHVHPFDLGYPGTLPSLSYSAVKASILSASALNCTVHKVSRFERKHYFYPDLPPGYQVTQQRWPLGSDGLVEFEAWRAAQPAHKKGDEKKRRRGDISKDVNANFNDANLSDGPSLVQLRIERLQMEQDTGKTTTHSTTVDNTTTYTSHIDYNRAGCALIEIVSHPDLRSAHEAAGAVEKIRRLLRHVGTCDGRMEMGSLRCDLNVSIAPLEDEFDASSDSDASQYLRNMRSNRSVLPADVGQRVEVKNLSSLRQIIAATEYEALRQTESSLDGVPTGRETRTFLVRPVNSQYPLGGETFCIRSKGDAVDYRFMPEPDLPPLVLDGETLGYDDTATTLDEYISDMMPESSDEAAVRLSKDYGLSDEVISVIISDPPAIAMLDESVDIARKEVHKLNHDDKELGSIPTLAANLLCNDLFALVKRSALEGIESTPSEDNDDELQSSLNHPISVEFSTVHGKRLGSLVAMLVDGSITSAMAKKILAIMFKDDLVSTPQQIAQANNFKVIADLNELMVLCESVVLEPKNAKQLAQYKEGGKNVWKIEKFFVGKIMSQSGGNAHPEKMKEALALVLEKVGSL